jgi:hypothetical protein
MTKKKGKPNHLPSLSLYPLKPEAALAAFMKVDPAKVESGMRKLPRNGGRRSALPKA